MSGEQLADQDPVRVAVVGLGRQGTRHARTLASHTRGRLAATVDPVAQAIEGVPHFGDVDALVAAMDLDAAIVATPVADHFRTAQRLLSMGIPTLVEKPMAATVQQGLELTTLAERTGTLLAVGHVERFNPCVRLVHSMLAKGTLGQPVALAFRRVGLPPPQPSDVGVIHDLAVHDIDVFHMLTGEVSRLVGSAGWDSGGTTESAHLLLVAGGVHGLVEVNWRTPVRIREFSLTTDQCLVQVNYTTQAVDVVEASKVVEFEEFEEFRCHYGAAQRTTLTPRIAEPLMEQLTAFLAGVRGEPTGPLATASDGLATLSVVEEAADNVVATGRLEAQL